jgi:hypothetical protein
MIRHGFRVRGCGCCLLRLLLAAAMLAAVVAVLW